MFYNIKNLFPGLGGSDGVRKAMEYFCAETVKAGVPALYLQPDNLYGYGYMERMKKVFIGGLAQKRTLAAF